MTDATVLMPANDAIRPRASPGQAVASRVRRMVDSVIMANNHPLNVAPSIPHMASERDASHH